MENWMPGAAFVVVVMRGPEDISRTTWPSKAEAKRYVQQLRLQGIAEESVRLYRARTVKPVYRFL